MLNYSRLNSTVIESNACHTAFHKNMVILMEFNRPSQELTRLFKEGMFLYPNKDGFIQVSYFLLKIIYPNTNAFRDCWPVFEKSREKEFRQTVCKIMRGLNNDFADITQFPEVGPGKLMSPGGDRFVVLIWKLSLLAMAVQAKRDLECYLLQEPSGRTSSDLIKCSKNIRKMITEKNIEEIEKMTSSLESFVNQFRESRHMQLCKIFELKTRIKDLESNVKDIDQYVLDYDLKKKILDLNSTEGISILNEKVSEKKKQVEEQYKCLKESVDVVRNWKRITEAVVNQEVHGHDFVLDGHHLYDDPSFAGVPRYKIFGTADIPKDDSQVSLLSHLRGPCEKLKSSKLDLPKANSQLHLEEWERVCKERQHIVSEFSKLEAELDRKAFELHVRCNHKKILPDEDQKAIESSETLCIPNNICASTPIKNKSNSPKNGKPADITPYQQPSNADYFEKKLKEILAKKIVRSSAISVENKVDPIKPMKKNSLEAIVERFKQLQLRMKMAASDLE